MEGMGNRKKETSVPFASLKTPFVCPGESLKIAGREIPPGWGSIWTFKGEMARSPPSCSDGRLLSRGPRWRVVSSRPDVLFVTSRIPENLGRRGSGRALGSPASPRAPESMGSIRRGITHALKGLFLMNLLTF